MRNLLRGRQGVAAVALALAMLLLTAACGGSKTTTGTKAETSTTAAAAAAGGGAGGGDRSAGGHDACDLLTPAEIKAAAAIEVAQRAPQTQGNVKTCNWASADHNINVNAFYYERAGDLIKNIKAADSKAQDVTGVGDAAVVQPEIGSITLVVGEIGIAINITPAPSVDALKSLGQTAAKYL